MAKQEVKTDLRVAEQLKTSGIDFDAQGSDVEGINEALKTASKRGTGKSGYPEYTAVIGDFVLVIEDKANLDRHIKLDDNNVLDLGTKAVTDYAVNGAVFYAKHIAQNSDFHEVFAVGVSGDEKHTASLPCSSTTGKGTLNWTTSNRSSFSLWTTSENTTSATF